MVMAVERVALRVYFDTSTLIAGTFSRTGASFALLQLAGLGIVDGRISPEVRFEAERNVRAKLPGALPALRVLLREALTEGESASDDQLAAVAGWADPKDRAILAAALAQGCRFLVTLNERDFWPPPDRITIVRPATLVGSIRVLVSGLEDA
jgi:predicted nucleic acid-binding protein